MATNENMDKEFEVRFIKQGNTWSAIMKNTENQAAYGNTPEEAFHNLFLEKDKMDYQNEIHIDQRSQQK